jgi:hypothetical protein
MTVRLIYHLGTGEILTAVMLPGTLRELEGGEATLDVDEMPVYDENTGVWASRVSGGELVSNSGQSTKKEKKDKANKQRKEALDVAIYDIVAADPEEYPELAEELGIST